MDGNHSNQISLSNVEVDGEESSGTDMSPEIEKVQHISRNAEGMNLPMGSADFTAINGKNNSLMLQLKSMKTKKLMDLEMKQAAKEHLPTGLWMPGVGDLLMRSRTISSIS